MVGEDVIRRLTLFDKGPEDEIHSVNLRPGHGDALSGGGKKFLVLALSESSIIVVLIRDMTAISWLVTAVTDKGSLFHSGTMLEDEVPAGLVTEVAVAAQIVTDDELAADICFSAAEPMDTEVVGVVERTPVPGVKGAMEFHFLGDRSRILAEVSCDILESFSFVQ